jgi:hypothetical protein
MTIHGWEETNLLLASLGEDVEKWTADETGANWDSLEPHGAAEHKISLPDNIWNENKRIKLKNSLD